MLKEYVVLTPRASEEPQQMQGENLNFVEALAIRAATIEA